MSRRRMMAASRPVIDYDPDAKAWFDLVEQVSHFGANYSTQVAVKAAVDAFVVGLKADGLWARLDVLQLLAGPATLAGAMVPMKGPVPTNTGFTDADFNQVTGLKGDGTKWIQSNYVDGYNYHSNTSAFAYISIPGNGGILGNSATPGRHMFDGWPTVGEVWMGCSTGVQIASYDSNLPAEGFVGMSRGSYNFFEFRRKGVQQSMVFNAEVIQATGINVFGRGGPEGTMGISVYGFGSDLDLMKLEDRINQYNRELSLVGFTPMAYAPTLWLDAADDSTLYDAQGGAFSVDGGPVGKWGDKVNHRDLLAPDVSKRPIKKAGVLNGKSVVRYDGSGQRLEALFTSQSQWSVIVVGVPRVGIIPLSVYPRVFTQYMQAGLETGAGSWIPLIGMELTDNLVTYADDMFLHAHSWVKDGMFIAIAAHSGTEVKSFFNDTWTGSSPATLGQNGYQVMVGGGLGDSSDAFQGDIAEVIVLPNYITDPQVLKLRSYLRNKWLRYGTTTEDNFDGPLLSLVNTLRLPDTHHTGDIWTLFDGAGGDNQLVQSSAVIFSNVMTVERAMIDCQISDCVINIHLEFNPVESCALIGFRMIDRNNRWQLNITGTTVILYRVVGGTFTERMNIARGQAVSVPMHVKLVMTNTMLKLYIDEVYISNFLDDQPLLHAPFCNIGGYSETAQYWVVYHDFKVTDQFLTEDTFQINVGTPLLGRTPDTLDTGSKWRSIEGTAGAAHMVDSVAVITTPAAGTTERMAINTGFPDGILTTRFTLDKADTGAVITFRYQTAQDHWYVHVNSTTIAIYAWVANVVYEVFKTQSANLPVGVPIDFKLFVANYAIELWINGAYVTHTSNGSNPWPTHFGIGCYNPTAVGVASYEYFKFEPFLTLMIEDKFGGSGSIAGRFPDVSHLGRFYSIGPPGGTAANMELTLGWGRFHFTTTPQVESVLLDLGTSNGILHWQLSISNADPACAAVFWVRYSDANNFYQINVCSNSVSLYKKAAGVMTQLGVVVVNIPAYTVFNFRVDLSGTQIWVYINDGYQLSTSDAHNQYVNNVVFGGYFGGLAGFVQFNHFKFDPAPV